MTENNKKLQKVVDHFNERFEKCRRDYGSSLESVDRDDDDETYTLSKSKYQKIYLIFEKAYDCFEENGDHICSFSDRDSYIYTKNGLPMIKKSNLLIEKVQDINNPLIFQAWKDTLENFDTHISFSLYCELQRYVKAGFHPFKITGYTFIGDKILECTGCHDDRFQEPELRQNYALDSDLKEEDLSIPREYVERIKQIRKGDCALSAIDVAFDIYEWDLKKGLECGAKKFKNLRDIWVPKTLQEALFPPHLHPNHDYNDPKQALAFP